MTPPSSRDHLLAKIRALLAKTLTNGCTQAESETALAKAKSLLQAYQITDEDLEQSRHERATVFQTGKKDDHQIQIRLAVAIAKFTNTKSWRNPKTGVNYCGLRSDTDFAQWLTTNLEQFIKCELFLFLMENTCDQSIINSFISGATNRINQRLRDLTQTPTTSSHQALIVIQNAAINQYMSEHGIHLKGSTKITTNTHNAFALNAGTQAGNRASFGRPLKSTTYRITHQNH